MKYVFWFALLVSVLGAAPAARADYKGTKWEMTPEQVAAAIPEARLDGRGVGDRLGDKLVVRNAGMINDGPRLVHASFYYDQRGLAMVLLKQPHKDCMDVLQGILDAHGNPYRISDQVLFKLFIWHDASQNNRLRLMVSSAKICDLHYERLDDYKAVDDEQAAQGK
jgi:hypothetical protein